MNQFEYKEYKKDCAADDKRTIESEYEPGNTDFVNCSEGCNGMQFCNAFEFYPVSDVFSS